MGDYDHRSEYGPGRIFAGIVQVVGWIAAFLFPFTILPRVGTDHGGYAAFWILMAICLVPAAINHALMAGILAVFDMADRSKESLAEEVAARKALQHLVVNSDIAVNGGRPPAKP